MRFTPENLLDNVERLGPWSSFHLAEIAIVRFFPEIRKINDRVEQIKAMANLCQNYEMQLSDWIILFHNTVGYSKSKIENKDYVNVY